jgi:hypothetical protein
MDYNSLTVAKLKDELKERDIPSTGLKLKKDFVDRLEQHDAETATQDPTSTLPTDDTSTETLTTEKPQTVTSPLTTTDLPPSNEDKPEQETTEPTQETALEQAPSPNSDAMELEPTTASTEPVQTEDAASPDSKKRKRRTPSPQASQDSAHKKQKQETDGPHLPEPTEQDNLHNQVDMPDVPLDQPDLTLQPMSTSDDLVQPFTNDSDKQKATRSPDERRFKNLVTSTDSDPVQPVPEPDDVTVSPAIHPATRALYIRHLVRPINPGALRDHLEDIARPADHSDTSASLVEECYVDALRTHAFVLFTSISAAARARASTHDRIWPSEPMRKQLWVDFFPDERFQEYLDTERSSGGSKPSQAKRWELAYNNLDDGVDVQLVEAGPAVVHRASTHAGAPNAPPTGPRGSMSGGRRPSFAQSEHRRSPPPAAHAPPSRRSPLVVEEASAPFLELDKLFNFTTTKPKLYWQPVDDKLADDRLDELDRETSRDWDPRADFKKNGDSLGRGLDQLKRYTFEDGDVLVDGGPEFGGGRAFARAGNRGRGRRNGDRYRGH